MFKIEEINKILNGEIHGNRDLVIKGPCGIQNGEVNHISYIKNKKYIKFIQDTDASAIIVDSSIDFSNISKQNFFSRRKCFAFFYRFP